MNNLSKLRSIIPNSFPRINNVYAYGSAVVQQKDNIGKMTDLIFVVDDVREFHKLNVEMNSNHYSDIAKALSQDVLANVNRFGTKIYYNPSIAIDNVFVKYGIIQESDFIYSLTNWDNLFVAGRFHKPVVKLDSNEIPPVYIHNLEAAVRLTNK
jgi:translocator assembly and maintenance protein 41